MAERQPASQLWKRRRRRPALRQPVPTLEPELYEYSSEGLDVGRRMYVVVHMCWAFPCRASKKTSTACLHVAHQACSQSTTDGTVLPINQNGTFFVQQLTKLFLFVSCSFLCSVLSHLSARFCAAHVTTLRCSCTACSAAAALWETLAATPTRCEREPAVVPGAPLRYVMLFMLLCCHCVCAFHPHAHVW